MNLERLIQIDECLRAQQRYTVRSMAEVLEVSPRTVRSDLAYLRDRLNAPLASNRVRGYHYTDPHWRLPSIPLTQGELFALTLGARILSAYSGTAYQEQLRSAISHLAKRLPEQTWINLEQITHESVLFRTGAALDLDPEIWHSLERACQQKQQVWMRYAGPGKPISERKINPYLLHFSHSNPYVTGWCHQRQETRWFRVDRIRSIKLLDEHFEIDPTFDRETHFASAFQHEVGGTPQEIVIWFNAPTAPYIKERRWHPTQQIEESPDGSLTLRLVVSGLSEVKRWVLFYGKGAKVLGPPALVEMIKEEVSTMCMSY